MVGWHQTPALAQMSMIFLSNPPESSHVSPTQTCFPLSPGGERWVFTEQWQRSDRPMGITFPLQLQKCPREEDSGLGLSLTSDHYQKQRTRMCWLRTAALLSLPIFCYLLLVSYTLPGCTLFWGDYLLPYKVGFSSAFLHCSGEVYWLLLFQPPPCNAFPASYSALTLPAPTLLLLSQPPLCTCSPSLLPCSCSSSPHLALAFPASYPALALPAPPCSCSPSPHPALSLPTSPPCGCVRALCFSVYFFL